jgi:hypothetical protein
MRRVGEEWIGVVQPTSQQPNQNPIGFLLEEQARTASRSLTNFLSFIILYIGRNNNPTNNEEQDGD